MKRSIPNAITVAFCYLFALVLLFLACAVNIIIILPCVMMIYSGNEVAYQMKREEEQTIINQLYEFSHY